MSILKNGLVQVYTGNGKGKTTVALGLAWRMLGWGGQVYICQFLKPAGFQTGEARLSEQFKDALKLDRLEIDWDMQNSFDDPEQIESMRAGISSKLDEIKVLGQAGKYDLMIFDELVFCLNKDLANWQEVSKVINSRASHVELILTGRGADERLIKQADLVSEIVSVKHPYGNGIVARRGIEY